MRKQKRLFLVLVTMVLLISFLLIPVFAAEIDYSQYFDELQFTLCCSDDAPAVSFYYGIYEAFILDPKAFIKELAFRDAAVQQAVIDSVVRNLSENYLKTIYETVTALYHMYEANPYTTSFPGQCTKSEHALIDVFIIHLSHAWNARTQAFRTDFHNLFQEVHTKTGSHSLEVLSYDLYLAVKGDPLNFLLELSCEPMQTRDEVVELLILHNTRYTGLVIRDSLSQVESNPTLSENAITLLTTLQKGLIDTPNLPTADGPDPEELAERSKINPPSTEPTLSPTATVLPETTDPPATIESILPPGQETDGSSENKEVLFIAGFVIMFAMGSILGYITALKRKPRRTQ